MKLAGAWLDEDRTQRLFDAYEGAGFRLLFVGGVVRNAALGLEVSDIDLATDAPPELGLKLAKAAGFRVVPTGVEHGTLTIVVDGLAHEVTTFRKDIETDGRHAEVVFTARLEEDAARRDFTINALYATRQGAVIDPMGGLEDIACSRVRFVGRAEDRVAEDYLRILRFFRFHAWYADPTSGIDADGLAAVAGGIDGIDRLAAERIGHEMLRLLAAPDPAPALAAMAQTGVLARVLPGASPEVVTRLVHFESGAAANSLRRLVALGGEDAPRRLRLSRRDARHLAALRDAVGAGSGLAELAWRDGAGFAWDVAWLRAAAFETPPPEDTAEDIETGARAIFPVKSADLMPDFEGAKLGAKLAELETRWIESGFTLNRAALLAEG